MRLVVFCHCNYDNGLTGHFVELEGVPLRYSSEAVSCPEVQAYIKRVASCDTPLAAHSPESLRALADDLESDTNLPLIEAQGD
jgi:hypothetical protein